VNGSYNLSLTGIEKNMNLEGVNGRSRLVNKNLRRGNAGGWNNDWENESRVLMGEEEWGLKGGYFIWFRGND